MRSIQSARPRVMPWALGLGLGLYLSACGGGDDAIVPVAPDVPKLPLVGSATGVLTDAPVQGVAYTTPSGVVGTTDALGRFTSTPATPSASSSARWRWAACRPPPW